MHLPHKLKNLITAICENQLALIAAVLLEVTILHFSYQSQNAFLFTTTLAQFIFESAPLLVAHYFAFKHKMWRAIAIWSAGFVIYPISAFLIADYSPAYAQWRILGLQGWVLLCVASAGYATSKLLVTRHRTKTIELVSRMFSLNSVLIMLLFTWAILWAGIFASTDDPVSNQPIEAVINSETVIVNFDWFLHYFWQFLLMGGTVFSIYWINRYVLIRLILTRNGVFAYVSACLICIVVMTPILGTIVLWLPMNIPEFTFLPSEDYNVFAPLNFRICFFVVAVSAPIILAFERQQQDRALAEIAQRQSQTELQLLQQQINPHFLFNTLNNLYALTLTNSKAAPQLVMQLSNLLRYTVYEGQNHRVTLAQEIQYLQDFLALQSIRSGDKCQIQVSLPKGAEHWEIAPLLLIILLENAFKHGVELSQTACTIKLDIEINNRQLIMRCENSLAEHLPTQQRGIGLGNLERRLSLLYSGKYKLVSKRHNNVWLAELTLELEPC